MKKTLYILLFIIVFTQVHSQSWSPINGFGWVYALTVYNGDLIAGGPSGIAKWNGATWSQLGTGVDGEVDVLYVFNGKLYAGGRFLNAGGIPVSYIASWDGSVWADLEGGVNGYVTALTYYNNTLIAGGYFTSANGPANYIASWNGSLWSPLGSGMGGAQGQVMALTVFSDLYAAGYFTTAGGLPANRIAKWNGTSWSALGNGVNNVVYALTTYNGCLITGGLFSQAGGTYANGVARWDGASWTAFTYDVFSGLYPNVMCLTEYNGNLYVGGLFTNIGSIQYNGIAKWNRFSWSHLGSGFTSSSNVCGAYASTIYNNLLVCGGIFNSAGGVPASNLAQWDGTIGINIISNKVPDSYKLYQNYPNPFNPSTKIRYTIKENGTVAIKVFDITGKEVKALVNEKQNAGEYEVTFNGNSLSSGIYIYKLESGDYSEAKKMTLLK